MLILWGVNHLIPFVSKRKNAEWLLVIISEDQQSRQSAIKSLMDILYIPENQIEKLIPADQFAAV